ncbi:MAG TPA: hypothetical protein PLO44_00255 [Candidatus Paceibacterota bacterium]|nr:hypothetical protein [Candidatus Paceibacterota bacterium]
MKKINEKLEKIFKSKILIGMIYAFGILIIAGLIFSAGVSVGFRKAQFNRAWGEHYKNNFGMTPPPIFGENAMPNAHGAVGKIIKITDANIIVQDRENIEKVVLIKENTQIQKGREQIKIADLKIDDFVVVIGSPNDQGQIEAKFVRLMPNQEFMMNNSNNNSAPRMGASN